MTIGLHDAKSLKILCSGELEKRRDGAVRAGWAKRFFLLTEQSLHYFRKVEPTDLFGEERGQLKLNEIDSAIGIRPEDAPYGTVEPGTSFHFLAIYTRQKSRTLFLRSTAAQVKEWADAITTACKLGAMVGFCQEWTMIMHQEFECSVTGEEFVRHPPKEKETKPIPYVALVSIRDDHYSSIYPEQVVAKGFLIDQPKTIEIPHISGQGQCCILFSNESRVMVSHQLLWEGSQSQELLTLRSKHEEGQDFVQVQLRIQLNPKIRNSEVDVVTEVKSAEFQTLPGALAAAFLVTCIVAALNSDQINGLMKLTIILGTILALSTLVQFVLVLFESNTTNASNETTKPAVSFRSYTIVFEKVTLISDATDSDGIVEESVPTPIQIPQRFIDGEKGNYEKGRQRYFKTLAWRQENGIDEILNQPHPHFDTIKKHYLQYFHGRSKENHPVYYELSGKIDLPALREAGLSMDDLLRHFIYSTEYLWRIIEPNEAGRSISVLDIAGVGMSDIVGEVMDFIKKASAVSGDHYPERSAYIYILNVPSWFSWTWRLIKPMIDPVTREKIHMVSGKSILKELQQHIADDQIPSDYGGQGVALGQSKEEIEFANFVHGVAANSTST